MSLWWPLYYVGHLSNILLCPYTVSVLERLDSVLHVKYKFQSDPLHNWWGFTQYTSDRFSSRLSFSLFAMWYLKFTDLTAYNAGYVRCKNAGADPHRFPPFYGNRWHFTHNNIFLIIKTLSTLKSGQYPVWMTRKPRKGDLRSKNPKKFPGWAHPSTLLESCAFGARLGNRLVFILEIRAWNANTYFC